MSKLRQHFKDWISGPTVAFMLAPMVGLLLLAASAGIHAENRSLLWEVSAGKKVAYIFGSIHVAKADFYPLPAAVESAYQKSASVAVEVDVGDATKIQDMIPYFTYPAGDQLERHLKPETWAKLKTLTKDNVAAFQQMKPAFLAGALVTGSFVTLGYSPDAGIDLHFIKRAKTDGKKLVELESAEFQARLLGNMDDADGDAMLEQTIDSLNNGEAVKQITQMVAAWKDGDAPALNNLLQESNEKDPGTKKLMKSLLDNRNPGMASKIGQLIRDGKRPFVVVGAAHMTGANSILVLLQKQGFKVRTVP